MQILTDGVHSMNGRNNNCIKYFNLETWKTETA
jgi:hypothetical protein